MSAENPPSEFPRLARRYALAGPAGAIEVASAWPEAPRRGMALICHPHPLFGGTMDNKVVTTLERVFLELGLKTLRFNFRGVGASAGVHDNGVAEGDDVAALVAWLRAVLPDHALWLAGFSFGSHVAARMARAVGAVQLVSIAPPVTKWDFDAISPGCPWLVVQGEQDEVVEPEAVYRWAAARPDPPTLIRMADTSHFFHGRLVELRQHLHQALSDRLPPPA